jgi:S-adenosylmethionine:tRNA ribosyltransferase-isomerase
MENANPMKLSDFTYELPGELIAQEPSKVRDQSRLMVLDRPGKTIREQHFSDITQYFAKCDVLVLNDTRVIPARLRGTLKTGGQVEVFLLKRLEESVWKTLVRPGKKLHAGTVFEVGGEKAEVLERTDDGGRIIRFGCDDKTLLGFGNVPLPPYIHNLTVDPERYQTVYSKTEGAVAAPTAGLHFTSELLSQIEEIGVKIAKVTLHVGIGTFRPIKTDNIDDHRMDFEWFSIPEETAQSINNARRNGGKIFACGTTVVRTLESSAKGDGTISPGEGETDLFIKPGYKFRAVDRLITNFHLPGSTLLLLVSAFAGKDFVFSAYRQAVDHRFRFFSFGDAMLIL